MAEVLHIKDDEFESTVLQSDKPVLLDFWAPWCGPCRKVTPILDELAGEMENVKFVKINIDENTASAARFSVMSIPTLLVFKGGEAVARQVGALSKSDLRAFIESNL